MNEFPQQEGPLQSRQSSPSSPRILVACIGNIFLSDDGFGVEVAKRLRQSRLPEAVRVVDFGIRGFDLALALAGNYQTVIFVDAIKRGEAAGTLSLLEADLTQIEANVFADAHDLTPVKALAFANTLGAKIQRVLIIGCEAESLDEGMGLSAAVTQAVDEAFKMIEELLQTLL